MPGFSFVLMLTLAFGVLAFGGVYPWAYALIAVASAELGLWAIVLGRAWNDWRVWRLAMALGLVAVTIALQMVPLPAGLFAFLTPNADAVLSQYELGYAARAVGWRPLSLSPWDTALALALFVSFALLLVGATRALRYANLLSLASNLTLLGLLVGLIGIVQKALLPEEGELIYGFWQPQFEGDSFGPFVNRNHYAGWVVMVLPVIAGRVIAVAESVGQRAGWHWRRWLSVPEAGQAAFSLCVIAVLGIAVILSGSRSGIVSLAVVLAVLAGVVLRRAGRSGRHLALAIAIPAVIGAGMVWAGSDIALRRFERVPTEIADRIAVWGDTVRIIRDFPVAGVGFGAFGKAMAVYQTAPTHTRFVQAHNDYLQVMAEGGALVSIPAAVVLILLVQGISRRFRNGDDEPARFWLRVGAVAGLCGIAAQSLVEFSLQKPGNTVLFVVLVALALHRPSRGTPHHAHRI